MYIIVFIGFVFRHQLAEKSLYVINQPFFELIDKQCCRGMARGDTQQALANATLLNQFIQPGRNIDHFNTFPGDNIDNVRMNIQSTKP